MTFGPVFKAFRESKGYQAQEVAEGIVSVQFLRRFEKGEADIRLSNFSLLLGRINVSFNDFWPAPRRMPRAWAWKHWRKSWT